MKFKGHIKIDEKDWDFFKSALLIYSIESFQSSALQSKIKELLKKYD